ncbi:hypothetical protein KAR91_50405 [Candidatus Pacearchaeota archaeon]|nr:hypothetical protein [Candidatus Pacearchaeota archaeon]
MSSQKDFAFALAVAESLAIETDRLADEHVLDNVYTAKGAMLDSAASSARQLIAHIKAVMAE